MIIHFTFSPLVGFQRVSFISTANLNPGTSVTWTGKGFLLPIPGLLRENNLASIVDFKSYSQSLCPSTCLISAQPMALNIYGAVEDQRPWLGVMGRLEALVWSWKTAHIKPLCAAISIHPGLLLHLVWSCSWSESKCPGSRTPHL